jgi:hypothetical protein
MIPGKYSPILGRIWELDGCYYKPGRLSPLWTCGCGLASSPLSSLHSLRVWRAAVVGTQRRAAVLPALATRRLVASLSLRVRRAIGTQHRATGLPALDHSSARRRPPYSMHFDPSLAPISLHSCTRRHPWSPWLPEIVLFYNVLVISNFELYDINFVGIIYMIIFSLVCSTTW